MRIAGALCATCILHQPCMHGLRERKVNSLGNMLSTAVRVWKWAHSLPEKARASERTVDISIKCHSSSESSRPCSTHSCLSLLVPASESGKSNLDSEDIRAGRKLLISLLIRYGDLYGKLSWGCGLRQTRTVWLGKRPSKVNPFFHVGLLSTPTLSTTHSR